MVEIGFRHRLNSYKIVGYFFGLSYLNISGNNQVENSFFNHRLGGGPRVVVSTAAFHARARGSVPGVGGLKKNKNVSSPSTCETQYCGEPPVLRTVSSQSSHRPQEVILAQFSLYVHKGGLKPDSFHFHFQSPLCLIFRVKQIHVY